MEKDNWGSVQRGNTRDECEASQCSTVINWDLVQVCAKPDKKVLSSLDPGDTK